MSAIATFVLPRGVEVLIAGLSLTLMCNRFRELDTS